MLILATEYLVACTVLYYLFARAEVTRWAWSRYPRALDNLARCAACSGFWIGLGLSWWLAPPLQGRGFAWERHLWGAGLGLLLTPVGTAILLYALAYTNVDES